MENDPPARVPVAGLWFGLFQPVVKIDGKQESVTDFYVAGTVQFELDADADWAVSPQYFPKGRYARSSILAKLHRLAYGKPDGLGVDAEQFLGLGYVCFVVKQLLDDIDLRLILGSREPVGVAAGFDAGDPLYIGFVTSNGFEVRDSEAAIASLKKRHADFSAMYPDDED